MLAIQVLKVEFRQWLVNNFGTWAEEEQECVKLIDQDCRNNSAWNQLYFCVNHRVMEDLDAADDIVAKQVEYTIEQLMLESDNECPFNYIRGLLQLSQKSIADYPNLMRTLNGLAEKNNRFSLAMLMMHSKTDVLKYRQYAGRLLEVDPIRENYWKYMLNSI